MRPLLLLLTAALAAPSCEPGLGSSEARSTVMLRVFDGGAPIRGLKVVALDDDSLRLGEALTDGDGVARIELAKPGPLWLASNAGKGRGLVTRVTAQAGGITDAGERALVLLDEQPSIFRLRGLGYEERLTDLDDGVDDFVILEQAGVALVLQRRWGPERDEWGQPLPSMAIVAVDLATRAARELRRGEWWSLYVSRIDGRFAMAWGVTRTRSTHLLVFDGLSRRLVFDQELPGISSRSCWDPFQRRRIGQAFADTVVIPYWRSYNEAGEDGHEELRVIRIDAASQESTITSLWSITGSSWNLATTDDRIIATAGQNPFPVSATEMEVRTFDSSTLAQTGGYTGPFARSFAISPKGATFWGTRYSGQDWELVQVDGETGRTLLLARGSACFEPRGDLAWSSSGRGLLGLKAPLRCEAQGQSIVGVGSQFLALFEGDASSLRALPTDGLTGGESPAYDDFGAPILVRLDQDPSGTAVAMLHLDQATWASQWQSRPGQKAAFLSWAEGGPPILLGAIAEAASEQIVVARRQGNAHTWARFGRSYRAVVSSDASKLWYMMQDPLTARAQLFEYALGEEVTP